jgi:hypothetical protein
MQNFGFSRLYDSKAGNPTTRGRMLDMLFCHVVYILPIFIGPNLAQNLGVINSYQALGWQGPSQLFQWVGAAREQLSQIALITGGAYLVFYVIAYARLVRAGHKLTRQKVMLLASTGLVSILAWGFLQPFQAFFIVNFYHGLQYFAIVWASEKKTMQRLLSVASRPASLAAAFGGFVLFVTAIGFLHEYCDIPQRRIGFALFTVVSLMHFWYDSFIWSVRKKQVSLAEHSAA